MARPFRRLSLCLFVLVTASVAIAPVHAQSSEAAVLTGRVTSEGAPVPGANVVVKGTTAGTSTSPDGTFRLNDLPPGETTLVVSAVGFETNEHTVTLAAGSTTRVHVPLTATVVRGEEVVVTGSMRETYVKDSPVKVEVVRTERLEQGAVTSNLMDVMNRVNGLTTQLNCAVCGTNAIRINGVEGPNTAVLIDGMPIMGALASVYGLNGIRPSIIDQVEVIKGPQSTLYGTQALGGVVNIITKTPATTPSLVTDVYVRSTQEGSVTVAASPTVGRFEGFVSGNGVMMEHFFDDNGDGFADEPMHSRLALFGKGTLSTRDGTPVLDVAAKVYGENRTGGVAEFSDDLRGSNTIYGESIYTRRGEFMADYRPAALDQRGRLRTALTVHDQDSYYGTEHYDAQQSIAFGQATWDATLSDAVQLLTGATVRYETYDDNTPATANGADRRFIPGVFSQADVHTGPVTTQAGLRLDHHSEHGVIPAPRLSVKYSPTPQTTVRASSGTGFRVVNVFTEDHAALTGSREVVFAEDLDPERSWSVTGSVEHTFPVRANPLTLTVDGFYTRFANKIIPDYDQDPRLIVYENLDGASVTQGLSVGVDQNLTVPSLSYNAGFTLMDVFTEVGGTETPVTYAPDYTGIVGATYQVRSIGVEVDYTARLVGPKRMPQFEGTADTSPAYATHDLKITKAFGDVNSARGIGVDAYLSVENLFDTTQDSPLIDPGNPFGPSFDTVYTWGPIVGRTVALGLRMNLR